MSKLSKAAVPSEGHKGTTSLFQGHREFIFRETAHNKCIIIPIIYLSHQSAEAFKKFGNLCIIKVVLQIIWNLLTFIKSVVVFSIL